jgi:aminotransferase
MGSSRIAGFGESVIREMGRLAQETGSINLAQGIPEGETPPEMLEAARQALLEGFNQYPMTWGAPRLRQAIADKAIRFNGISCDPERNATVCCGSTEGMQAALLALTEVGDEVIIVEPYYENYLAQCRIAGATPVFVRSHPPDWSVDPDDLRRAFTNKTKAIILNTPGNPTGYVWKRSELELVAELCQRYGALAFTDEIYEHIIYGETPHLSIATLPGMAERTVTVSGLSKTFCVTGWRLGYCIASDAMTESIRKVHDFLTIGAPHPLQIAGAVALSSCQGFIEELRVNYQRRRDILFDYLTQAGFQAHRPEGAYYILAGYEGLAPRGDLAFVRELAREAGVTTVPGSCFTHDKSSETGMVRFMFAKRDEVLHKAGQRLVKFAAR